MKEQDLKKILETYESAIKRQEKVIEAAKKVKKA